MVNAVLSPDAEIYKVRFLGKKVTPDLAALITSASISMSMDAVTELSIRMIDPDYKWLAKGVFAPKIPVDYQGIKFLITALDTDDDGGIPTISLSCTPQMIDRLKRRTGTLVLKGRSASDFVAAECKAVGAKYVVQPCAKRTQVARDVKQKDQKYDASNMPSSWTTFSRLAGEEGYNLYEYNGTVYFGKQSWLLATSKATAFVVDHHSSVPLRVPDSLPKCSTSADEKAKQVQVSMRIGAAVYARTGRALLLKGVPTFNGTYLINSVSYDLLATDNAVQISASTAVNLEASDPGGKEGKGSFGSLNAGKPYTASGIPWLDKLLVGLTQAANLKAQVVAGNYQVGGGQASGGGTYSGGSSQPVRGFKITTAFGVRGSWAAGYHTGADYACPTGTPVYAVYDGAITSEQWGSAYGTHLILNVQGVGKFGYMHLSRKVVGPGQQVTAGQVIGYSGATGRVTGPHLHFEFRLSPYRYGTDARNPSNYLGKKNVAGSSAKYTSGPSGSKQVGSFVNFCLNQTGDRYVYGAEVSLSNKNPTAFDCSELVQWAAYQAGIRDFPDGTWAQEARCRAKGTMISVSTAYKTYGALLFRSTRGKEHVAVSLGNGKTIEAMGRQYGVLQGNASGRGWTAAAKLPGLIYAPPKTVFGSGPIKYTF